MTLLEKHFDTAFAAPDGIKKLRELILTLAMQGKLVPQNPHDQPASELLQEITAEKKRLVKEGKIKAGSREDAKTAKGSNSEEVTYELPKGWEWVRLGDIAFQITDGAHHTPTYVNSGIPFLSVKDMSSGHLSFSDTRYISKEQHENLSKRCHPEKGDLLLTKIGTTGVPVLVETEEEFSIFVSVALIKFSQKDISGRFLSHLVKSPLVKKQSEDGTEGVGNKNLVLRKINDFIIPLPPLAEQHRIVAKIDQLMARCDELEKLRVEREQKRLTVHTAALSRLFTAAESNDFSTAWRFITQHFGELYSVKENVAELRKAILQLAVMGKLVPQDPHDQPACELLQEIETEKKRLVKEGNIKAQKPLPEIKPEEVPYSRPEGWEWVRFGVLATEITTGPFGSMVHKSDYIENGVPLINPSHMVSGKIIHDQNVTVSAEKANELDSHKLFEGDIVMARRGEMGRCALVDKLSHHWLCGTGSFVLRFIHKIDRSYILTLFNAEGVRDYLGGNSVGATMTNLNHGILNKMPIMLPPLPEQHRIVAKIDQLMTLCDAMEQKIDDATGKRTALLNAVMAQV